MMRIGAHMSVAGGVSLAVDRAALHGCEALQIFAKNANQWHGAPLQRDDIRRFRRRLDRPLLIETEKSPHRGRPDTITRDPLDTENVGR